jgi:uncharacterized protein
VYHQFYSLNLSEKLPQKTPTSMLHFNKRLFVQLFLFAAIASISYSCLVPEKDKMSLKDSINVSKENGVDNDLATQLGADEYGMKMYVMAFLKKGRKRWMIDSATANKLQKEHMDNIKRLAEEGKLVVAGPFEDNTDLRGIYIFDVKTIEEAQQLCATDPAIKAESLTMELHPWYGSAALMKVNEIHKKITKK